MAVPGAQSDGATPRPQVPIADFGIRLGFNEAAIIRSRMAIPFDEYSECPPHRSWPTQDVIGYADE